MYRRTGMGTSLSGMAGVLCPNIKFPIYMRTSEASKQKSPILDRIEDVGLLGFRASSPPPPLDTHRIFLTPIYIICKL